MSKMMVWLYSEISLWYWLAI